MCARCPNVEKACRRTWRAASSVTQRAAAVPQAVVMLQSLPALISAAPIAAAVSSAATLLASLGFQHLHQNSSESSNAHAPQDCNNVHTQKANSGTPGMGTGPVNSNMAGTVEQRRAPDIGAQLADVTEAQLWRVAWSGVAPAPGQPVALPGRRDWQAQATQQRRRPQGADRFQLGRRDVQTSWCALALSHGSFAASSA